MKRGTGILLIADGAAAGLAPKFVSSKHKWRKRGELRDGLVVEAAQCLGGSGDGCGTGRKNWNTNTEVFCAPVDGFYSGLLRLKPRSC
ncbi:unnamed protein product [Gongylonema pulchrum]|uniref:Secreted protein n=1 Tax=Gongylonema pulchrum TaxID=637853 RepID=A0A183CZ04_9BILA|nr:unnamed protein product [Gongylonema pulchrum]